MDSFVKKLKSSPRTLFGTWVKLSTFETVQMLAQAGFDFVVIDAEHSPLSLETIYNLTAFAQSLGMSVLVRIPDQATNDIQRLLDIGVDGLLVPRVRNKAEAKNSIDKMIFSPKGTRGLGITSRAGLWGQKTLDEYVQYGNEEILRCIQLEDKEVLENMDEVLDVEGVNAAFIGMGDLTMTTGLPPTDAGLQALNDKLIAACKARNIPCGAAARDAQTALKAAERGFAFVMVSNDATMFGQVSNNIIKQIRAG